MCVGLAARVVKVNKDMVLVDASGARREVSAELLDELDPGDYVMIHAGMAIAKITADDEAETTALLEDL
ncbi:MULTISPECIES: HypC/HybG/HupF family hydrogenase formation chaperone [Megasphaera]|uniref:Hydrogenase assembly chaperone HypC/HupF n=1 Tax=Megasphaera vaginalis (ex Srinivasan et al. 2021) TaxID=1111454 RepID=U7UJR4_9FIRM|nr:MULTISPECIES: HypC/HybG/HupF family hydrogenase formation chaperone [Megasphaera]ERT58693.1 hydrogenase assembly chaperone HypC/HupF [Megasphaera vaginalis (ex Srinivasan et al. 2021)]